MDAIQLREKPKNRLDLGEPGKSFRVVNSPDKLVHAQVCCKPESLVFDNGRGRTERPRLDRLFSPRFVADYLGVKPKFVYERIRRGEMEFERVGKNYRIKLSTLESWLLREKRRP